MESFFIIYFIFLTLGILQNLKKNKKESCGVKKKSKPYYMWIKKYMLNENSAIHIELLKNQYKRIMINKLKRKKKT